MNVYWTIYHHLDISSEKHIFSDLEFFEPENVFEKVVSTEKPYIKNKDTDYTLCPSVNMSLKNTYSIKFPFDYSLFFNQDSITSDMYDQKFFNKFVKIRSVPDKLLSINVNYLFFSEKNLEMISTSPYFSNNEFSRFNRIIPGKFNINNWLRPVEIVFKTNPETNNITMRKGDDAFYITFLSNEKIKLKKFFLTDKVNYFVHNNLSSKNYKKGIYKLEYLYKKFKLSKQKNYILKEIKNNLME